MSAAPVPPAQRITVDDLRRKAENIRDMAKADAKRVVTQDSGQMVVIGVAVVLATVSMAYFLGAKAGARRVRRRRPVPVAPQRPPVA
jgi:hypothetical protein